MLHRMLVVGLVILLVIGNSSLAFSQSRTEQDSRTVSKVRETLSIVGTGEKARVSVKLRDKTVLGGYVVRLVDNGLVLKESGGSQERSLSFAEIESVKKAGKSTGKKIIIWTVVGVGGLAAVLAIGAKATSGGIRSH